MIPLFISKKSLILQPVTMENNNIKISIYNEKNIPTL